MISSGQARLVAREEAALKWMSVSRVVKETLDTYTIYLKPKAGERFSFKPGQFNMLYAFGVGEVPISISGDPEDRDNVAHTIRAVGAVTNSLTRLREGGRVGVRGPFGRGWPMEEAMGKDIVIVAGGIGLAPLRPVVYQLISKRQDYGKVFILYGARTPNDLLYKKELKSWKGRMDMDVLVTVDKGDETWKGNVGVVTMLFDYVKLDPDNTYAFVCGPEIMMRFTVINLKNKGLPDDKIFLSMERNMKCGIGICGHCQFGPYFVCKDGPVFRYTQVKNFFGRHEF